jgi:hypothetical protein
VKGLEVECKREDEKGREKVETRLEMGGAAEGWIAEMALR